MAKQDRSTLKSDIDSNLADFDANTPSDVRTELKDLVDSLASLKDKSTFEAQQKFNAGLKTGEDVVDDQGNRVYDHSEQRIEPKSQDVSPSIDTPFYTPDSRTHNPILHANDVTDISGVDFVADPFVVRHEGTWYCFFEVYDGNIKSAYATSEDGRNWTYQSHLADLDGTGAYEYVFRYQDTWYMVRATSIYEADPFPTGWTDEGTDFSFFDKDFTPFQHPKTDDWYVICGDTDGSDSSDKEVELWYSDNGDLFVGQSGWTQHSDSPLFGSDLGQEVDSPGGRPIVQHDRIICSMQDFEYDVSCFVITQLSHSSVTVSDRRPLAHSQEQKNSWLDHNAHHIDSTLGRYPGASWGVMDAQDQNGNFAIGLVTPNRQNDIAGKVVNGADKTVDTSGNVGNVNLAFNGTAKYNSFVWLQGGGSPSAPFESMNNGLFNAPTSGLYRFHIRFGIKNINSTVPFRIRLIMNHTTTNSRGSTVTSAQVWNEVIHQNSMEETVSYYETRYLNFKDQIRFQVTNYGDGTFDIVGGSNKFSTITFELVR